MDNIISNKIINIFTTTYILKIMIISIWQHLLQMFILATYQSYLLENLVQIALCGKKITGQKVFVLPCPGPPCRTGQFSIFSSCPGFRAGQGGAEHQGGPVLWRSLITITFTYIWSKTKINIIGYTLWSINKLYITTRSRRSLSRTL